MELSQLRTLIHVAELGSLSKAADRMRVAQPALSRQVRLLEQELGVQLFVRHGRGMVLTEQGQTVLAHATQVMRKLDDIRSDMADGETPMVGQVAIGLPPTVADIISVPLVCAFRAHPGAVPRLVSAYTGYLLDWLHRGEIDLAVLYDPRSARSLRSRPLLVEHLHLIGPAEAGLSTTQAVPFRELKGRPLLLPSARHGLRAIVERCAAESGIALNVVAEADSFGTLKDLVRHGYGWTVLPTAPIHRDIESGQLTAAPLTEPAPERRLVLAFPADRPASRLARFAGEAIESIVLDQARRGIWTTDIQPSMGL
jgi:LysR family nitrogen assimilation transcriptional regulator